jgi:hypothetical protein
VGSCGGDILTPPPWLGLSGPSWAESFFFFFLFWFNFFWLEFIINELVCNKFDTIRLNKSQSIFRDFSTIFNFWNSNSKIFEPPVGNWPVP